MRESKFTRVFVYFTPKKTSNSLPMLPFFMEITIKKARFFMGFFWRWQQIIRLIAKNTQKLKRK